jgi:hypothetical protein
VTAEVSHLVVLAPGGSTSRHGIAATSLVCGAPSRFQCPCEFQRW